MSTKQGFTPGPWLSDGVEVYTQSRRIRICRMIAGDGSPAINSPASIREANSRLIVASPDLLGACKSLAGLTIEPCEQCDGTGKRRATGGDACAFCGGVGEIVSGHFHPDELRVIRAAISKAEGKEALTR